MTNIYSRNKGTLPTNLNTIHSKSYQERSKDTLIINLLNQFIEK